MSVIAGAATVAVGIFHGTITTDVPYPKPAPRQGPAEAHSALVSERIENVGFRNGVVGITVGIAACGAEWARRTPVLTKRA